MSGGQESGAEPAEAVDPDPGPAAAVEGRCQPYEPIDVERWSSAGIPLLGVIPPFAPADPGAWYADGVVPAPRTLPADGPGVRPRFKGRPTLDGGSASLQPVVDTLLDEIAVVADRPRLAIRLHALANLLLEGRDTHAAAIDALRCAVADDPDLSLARWDLEATLGADGAVADQIALLDRPGASAEDLHRAGHLARGRQADPEWALDLWWSAAEQHAGRLEPLLASYLLYLEQDDGDAAAQTAELIFNAAGGADFWGVLSLDRIVRARGFVPEEELQVELEQALERSGGTPAAVALADERAFTSGDLGLGRACLIARLATARARGADDEVGILLARRGWLEERAGAAEAALDAYADALEAGGAPPFAQRRALALARQHDDWALIHQLQSLAATAASSPAARAAALLEKAEAGFKLGRAAQARTDLARAVELDRTHIPALAALGRTALSVDDQTGVAQLLSAEIEALGAVDEGERARLAPRLVDRALRLAWSQLQSGGGPKAALDACRRALSAAPADRSAFLTAVRVFSHLDQWAALAALYTQRAGLDVSAEEAVECLAIAADLHRVRLGDVVGAAGLLARALALDPDHGYALRRAAEVFALAGERGAWAEAECRRAKEQPALFARAGRLLEYGDGTDAPAQAFAAAARHGPDPAAYDGLLRAVARGADPDLLSIEGAAGLSAPLIRLAFAEAQLASGAAACALATLDEVAPEPGDPLRSPWLALAALAAGRAGAWHRQAELVELRAATGTPAYRARSLLRAGQIFLFRAGETVEALRCFNEAAALDPDSARVAVALGAWTRPTAGANLAGPRAAAARARAAGDWAAHDGALLEAAEIEAHPAEAAGLRWAAGEAAPPTDLPHRTDLLRRALEAAPPEARAGILWAHAEQLPAAERHGPLARCARTALAQGEDALARAAAEALLALQPQSIVAALVLGRLDALGDGDVQRPLAVLDASVRAPTHQAAVDAALTGSDSAPWARARHHLRKGAVVEARAELEAAVRDGAAASGADLALLADLQEQHGAWAEAAATRADAFALLSGAEAAEQAARIAEIQRERLGDADEAGRWLDEAVRADPGRFATAEGLGALPEGSAPAIVADAVDRATNAIIERLGRGIVEKPDLEELLRLQGEREDALGVRLAREAAAYVGAIRRVAAAEPLDGRMDEAAWARMAEDEASPTLGLIDRLAAPLAAAFAPRRPRSLVGAERWQARIAAVFERLGLAAPPVALASDAAWGGLLAPEAIIAAPAREAPLDGPARFALGQLAAGFGRGRLLLWQQGPEAVAGALAALRRGVVHTPELAELEGAAPADVRARLSAAAGALEPDVTAELAATPIERLLPDAVAEATALSRHAGYRVGLVACGDLPLALDRVLQRGGGSARARFRALSDSASARALLGWALGAEHRAIIEGGQP